MNKIVQYITFTYIHTVTQHISEDTFHTKYIQTLLLVLCSEIFFFFLKESVLQPVPSLTINLSNTQYKSIKKKADHSDRKYLKAVDWPWRTFCLWSNNLWWACISASSQSRAHTPRPSVLTVGCAHWTQCFVVYLWGRRHTRWGGCLAGQSSQKLNSTQSQDVNLFRSRRECFICHFTVIE